MDSNRITDILISILKEVHNDHTVLKKDNYSLPLTGSVMQFNYQEMVYAFVKLQQIFKIRFEKCDVENYGFNSIEKISAIVSRKLSS